MATIRQHGNEELLNVVFEVPIVVDENIDIAS